MTEDKLEEESKEIKYKILEKVVLNFMTPQDQYSAIFGPGDVEIIADEHNVYFIKNGKRHLTIDYPYTMVLYERNGWLKRV